MGIDNDQNDHKRDCLARWMLDHWKTVSERRKSLARMERHNGKLFADDLKVRMMAEWTKRKKGL